MFDLNTNTETNKEFKIKDILKLLSTDKSIKKETTIIEKIILTNVISEDTLNIKCDETCKEIFILRIYLNEKEIPLEFIKAFDKIIQLHTFFIFQYKHLVKDLCIYREVINGEIKRGNVYESEWKEEENLELPYCINISEVYGKFLNSLIPLMQREKEPINNFLERFNNVKKIKKEINTLEKKAFKEVQPRKKFDLGRQIRIKKELLKELEG